MTGSLLVVPPAPAGCFVSVMIFGNHGPLPGTVLGAFYSLLLLGPSVDAAAVDRPVPAEYLGSGNISRLPSQLLLGMCVTG